MVVTLVPVCLISIYTCRIISTSLKGVIFIMSDLESIGEISTLMKVLKSKYEWKIHEFSTHAGKDSVYRSQNFHLSDSTWFLKISPQWKRAGSYEYEPAYVSLYLHRLQCPYPVTADISCGIKTLNRIVVNEKEMTYSFTDDKQACGWCCFIDRSKLVKNKSLLMPSDTLTIICSIEMKNTPVFNTKYVQLSQDLRNLFNSKENPDVTLNVKDKTFLAHKIIVGARSPVFAAMFKNEMVEKKTGIVNIPDCDPKAFSVFLIYLYSGSVDLSKCSIWELYKITEKYDVNELKLICTDFIIKNLCVENFCDIFIVSDQFSDVKLLTEAQRFFEENFEKIISSEYWESLLEKDFRLANKLLKAMAPKFKNINVSK